MHQSHTPRRSYRATLIPQGIELDEVEFQADKGLLPTIRVKSADASQAMADAHLVSGRPVLKVERVDEVRGFEVLPKQSAAGSQRAGAALAEDGGHPAVDFDVDCPQPVQISDHQRVKFDGAVFKQFENPVIATRGVRHDEHAGSGVDFSDDAAAHSTNIALPAGGAQ